MNIFISQTRGKSREVAKILQVWLREEMRLGEPWMSEDIPGGEDWQEELNKAMKQARFGILCITADSLSNTWIVHEAAVLGTKEIKVCPYVIDLDSLGDLPAPIRHLQAKRADEDGTKNLILAINKALDHPFTDTAIKKAFKSKWPKLKAKLEELGHPLKTVGDYEELIKDFVEIFGDVNQYRESLAPMLNGAIEQFMDQEDYDTEKAVKYVYKMIEEKREAFNRVSKVIGNVRDFFKEQFTEDNLREKIVRLEPILFSDAPPETKRDRPLRQIEIEQLEVYLRFHQILVNKLRDIVSRISHESLTTH